MPPLGKSNDHSKQKTLSAFFRPYTIPKNVVRNEDKTSSSFVARPPSPFAAFATRTIPAPSRRQTPALELSSTSKPTSSRNSARNAKEAQSTPKLSSITSSDALKEDKGSNLEGNTLERSRPRTPPSVIHKPVLSESNQINYLQFTRRPGTQQRDTLETPERRGDRSPVAKEAVEPFVVPANWGTPSVPEIMPRLPSQNAKSLGNQGVVESDASSPSVITSHATSVLPRGVASGSVLVKAEPTATPSFNSEEIMAGKTTSSHKTPNIIDLTLSSSPRSLSTVTSVESTHKRRRSSITSHDSSSSTESEPESKIRRTDSRSARSIVPSRDQQMKRQSQPPPSSQLTVFSRTPSLESKVVGSQKCLGSTQERAVVIQSSQSDENEEVEEIEASYIRPGDDSANEDGFSSDSDSSLEDLTALFSKRKLPDRQAAKTPTAVKINPNTTSRVTRSQLVTSTIKREKPQSFAMPLPSVYKFSLDKLVKQNQRDSKAQIEIEKAKAAIAKDDDPVVDQANNASTGINLDYLNTIMIQEGDEENVERLLHAMQRADVLETETDWNFFQNLHQSDPAAFKTMVFPSLRSDSNQLLRPLNDQPFREHAFLTGFASAIFSVCGIPEELLLWMWQSVFSEPRSDLSNAYIYTLKNHQSKLQRFLHPGRIRKLFETLQAKPAALNISYSIEPSRRTQNSPRRSAPPQLLRIIKVLGELADCLSIPSKIYAINILLRLCVDTDIINSGEVRLVIQRSLALLVDDIPEHLLLDSILHIADTFYSAIDDPILQHRLVFSIPASTYKTHAIRRNLALAFVLQDHSLLSCPLNEWGSAVISSKIVQTLETSPRFSTTSSTTDYRALGALISLLDIGIDRGFSPLFPQPILDAQLQLLSLEPTSLHPFIRTHDEGFDIPKQEKDFNASIDALVHPIRILARGVGDSGTSHMARNDAKGVAERLIERLEYGVRTKPKPKRGVWAGFGAEVGDFVNGGKSTWVERHALGGDRKLMEAWMAKGKGKEKEVMDGEEEAITAGGGRVAELTVNVV